MLDPFMGSGSSRIAAWELGIPYVGIERDKVYYDLQEQRFKEWTGQQLLDFSDVE